MFEPELEGAMALMESICPHEDDQIYLDVLALEDPRDHVEEVIRDFYRRDPSIPDEVIPLLFKSPYHVSWHTDVEGREYRIVVIDNRPLATIIQSLARFNHA